MDISFSTMDHVYVQVISGFFISVVSIFFINFFIVKQKFLLPSLFGGFKFFKAAMGEGVRPDIKLVRAFFNYTDRSTSLMILYIVFLFPQVPKHVAVIMDGNRRFGKITHHDPIQVR